MADPNQAANSPINKSQTVWMLAGNGLVSYAYDISRVTEAINQGFKQSPYLSTK
jgi:hypothetical protein